MDSSSIKKIPTADTIYLIMHTSGTRNEIKGAMLTHRNLLSGLSNCDYYGYDYFDSDRFFSYVPFCHVFEQIMIGLAVVFGCRFGFMSHPISAAETLADS